MLKFTVALLFGHCAYGCTSFTVVTKDKLDNINQGVESKDLKWIQKLAAKNGLCYVEPGTEGALVFWSEIVPDPEQREARQAERQSGDGIVPALVARHQISKMKLVTLTIERKLGPGKFEPIRRFQRNNQRDAIEDAAKWIGNGGLNNPLQTILKPAE
jgi:hypothetical protein